VEFAVARGDNSDPADDGACAIIDVVSDFGQTEIAFDFVMLSDLGVAPRTISLAFDLAESRTLEFRLYTQGRAPLLVADAPLLRLRDGEVQHRRIPGHAGRAFKKLFWRGVPFRVDHDRQTFTAGLDQFGDLMESTDRDMDIYAREIAERVAFKGDHENRLYRAFVGTDRAIVSPPREIPLTSTLCQQYHFGLDQYRFWAEALKERPKYYRKQWEFFFIAQALYERGLLVPGKKGLVFGAGEEQLPALFASYGVEVLASDQAPEDAQRSGWTATGQHTFDMAALNQRGICSDRMFSALVSFIAVDMNAIPGSLDGQFDFCWSACALEHLGSLEHGLRFIENSMRTLRPGGVAVHTTEFNLLSNDDTLESEFCSFYRRRDIEDVVRRLERGGHAVSPIDWTIGEGFAERVADFPPYGRGEPHIRVASSNYEVTSIGLIATRG
jgi:SAM-dependent methyltransferase